MTRVYRLFSFARREYEQIQESIAARLGFDCSYGRHMHARDLPIPGTSASYTL